MPAPPAGPAPRRAWIISAAARQALPRPSSDGACRGCGRRGSVSSGAQWRQLPGATCSPGHDLARQAGPAGAVITRQYLRSSSPMSRAPTARQWPGHRCPGAPAADHDIIELAGVQGRVLRGAEAARQRCDFVPRPWRTSPDDKVRTGIEDYAAARHCRSCGWSGSRSLQVLGCSGGIGGSQSRTCVLPRRPRLILIGSAARARAICRSQCSRASITSF